ncbi:MAG: RodZ domain-containing protein [Casimicrobiaceae bacterium]
MTGAVDARSGAVKAAPATLSGSAGAALRAARVAAGLPLDAIAQQLKLAPRQVQALEDDDYQHLPGRTFVRGFARNYARFVHLDPDAVLALLPAGEAAPALERPTLAPTRRPMGELPIEGVAKRSAIRWLIPLLLLSIVAAAGYYEYTRQQDALRGDAATRPTGAPSPSDVAPGARSAPADRATPAAPGTSSGTRSTPLPNPLAGSPPAPAVPGPETTGQPQSPAPAAPGVGTVPGTRGSASANEKALASGGALVLAFKGRSWVEIRDANGHIVLRSTETAGTTRTVAIAPPLELALGNARQVDATFRGQPLDLGPYTRGNVARVSLK